MAAHFKRIGIATIVVWSVATTAWMYLTSAAVLSGPRDGELYAYSWSYQLGSRLIVFGPVFLVVLAAILLVEWLLLLAIRRLRHRA